MSLEFFVCVIAGIYMLFLAVHINTSQRWFNILFFKLLPTMIAFALLFISAGMYYNG